jgi:hypothetical protein
MKTLTVTTKYATPQSIGLYLIKMLVLGAVMKAVAIWLF